MLIKVNLTLRLFSFNHQNSVLQEGGHTINGYGDIDLNSYEENIGRFSSQQ
jgi:hypothetical protein